jgi:hypothetical protein
MVALLVGLLDLEELPGVVHVTRGLDWDSAQAASRLVGSVEAPSLHVPPRRLGAEVDLDHDDQRRDRGRSKHPTPLSVLAEEVGVLERHRRDVTQANTKGSPHLPHHGEGATDVLGRALGRVHGRRGRLGTHSETEGESSDQKVHEAVGLLAWSSRKGRRGLTSRQQPSRNR